MDFACTNQKNRISSLPPAYNIETHPCFPQLGESSKSAPSSLVAAFFTILFMCCMHITLSPCLPQLGESLKSTPSSLVGGFFAILFMCCSEATSPEFFGLLLAIPFCLSTKDSDSPSPGTFFFRKEILFLWMTFFRKENFFLRGKRKFGDFFGRFCFVFFFRKQNFFLIGDFFGRFFLFRKQNFFSQFFLEKKIFGDVFS